MRRGQITLYIIIAILVLSAVSVVLYTQKDLFSKKTEYTQQNIKSVNFFISSCIEKTAEDALFFTGQQGGYYIPAQNSAGSVAYYFYDNKSYFPKKEVIEQQLALYMSDNLKICTANFSNFTNLGVSYGEINSTVKILSDRVRFNVYWPVIITQTSKYELNSFSADIHSRLSLIYDVSEKIVAEQLKSHAICLSCIADLNYQNNLYMAINGLGEKVVFFTIKDEKVLLNNQPYEFTFANRY